MQVIRWAIALAALLAAPAASACGGFFCNNSQPVDQAGEQILFSVDGKNVTTHVQIQYQGPSEDFSWVLPLPSVPEFGIGTDEVFTNLRSRTDPRFYVDWIAPEEGCSLACEGDDCWDEFGGDDGAGSTGMATGGDTGGGNPGIEILAEGEVGPFEFLVISAEDGSELFQWLIDNDYDQPPSAESIVTHYVNLGHVFVALKLQKGKDAGSIQPLVMTYEAPDLACIPLRLTSIAATPDMPIFAWVLAKARAVPMNFFHVLLNPKKLDWLRCGQARNTTSCAWNNGWWGACDEEYLDLVTEAADQANGHAFVTEYAGKSSIMEKVLWSEGRFATTQLKTITDPGEFLQQLLWDGWPRTPQMQEIIMAFIPKPPMEDLPSDCQTDQEFYTWNLEYCLQFMPEGWEFDPVGFVAELETQIVEPLKAAQGLFDNRPYLTRLFTTQSADEMTLDPIFSFNPDMPPVSNEHAVTAQPVCADGATEAGGVKIAYPGGGSTVVAGTFDQCQGFVPSEDEQVVDTDAPAASEVQVLGEQGGALVVANDDLDEEQQKLMARSPSSDAADAVGDPSAPGGEGSFGGAADDEVGGLGGGSDDGSGTGTGDSTAGTDGSATGGSTGTRSNDDSGCTVSTTAPGGGSAAPMWLLLAALALLTRRRTA